MAIKYAKDPETGQEIVPADTRYVPLQQTPYGCCPTAIQIVMLRHGIPLVPAELIGWHLGLVIPPEDAKYFYNPRVSATSELYGCFPHPGDPEIDPDVAFKALDIPLSMTIHPVGDMSSEDAFKDLLSSSLGQDLDVLMSVRWKDVMIEETITEPSDPEAGHILVVDKFDGKTVRIVDPGRGPKWREYEAGYLYRSMEQHANPRMAGIWVLRRTDSR